MKLTINKKLILKSTIVINVLLFTFYWFSQSICFGYWIAKLFFKIFDFIQKKSVSKQIVLEKERLKKKFQLKNILKTIIHFFYKIFKNWVIAIKIKSFNFIKAVYYSLLAIKPFLEKLFKNPLKFKSNFCALKDFWFIFAKAFEAYISLINEIFYFVNIKKWFISWKNIILSLLNEYLNILTIAYGLCFIFLIINGFLIGFLLALYKRNNKKINRMYLLLLFLLLYIFPNLSQMEYDENLRQKLKLLYWSKIENLFDQKYYIDQDFEKFSLKFLEPIKNKRNKFIFKEFEKIEQMSPIPYPIFDESSINVDINTVWNDDIEFKFELFEFYQEISCS